LDIALFDAVGRRNQLPAHQLLGPPVRDSLPIYLSGILRPTIEGRIAHANEWIDNGLQGTKLFLTPDLDECLKEIQALQTGCPDMQRWMVDMSWMLSLDVAITAKQAFHDANVEFLECPLQPEDLAGHRRLWKEQGTPIALGEHFRTAYQLVDWLNGDRALDVYQPDVGHTGFSDGVRQLGMAWESNLEATIHMSGSAVLQAATFTLSSICRPTHLQEYMPRMTEKMSDAIDSGWVYRNGEIPVSDRPGLGVDVFPDKLAPFVVR
jgi:galactonate dehydratase